MKKSIFLLPLIFLFSCTPVVKHLDEDSRVTGKIKSEFVGCSMDRFEITNNFFTSTVCIRDITVDNRIYRVFTDEDALVIKCLKGCENDVIK